MAARLGFTQADADTQGLVNELLAQMADSGTDYTNFFRALGEIALGRVDGRDFFSDRDRFRNWRENHLALLRRHTRLDEDWLATMHATNPKYTLRNYLAQIAIDAAGQQDYSELDRLFRLLQRPFDEHPGMEHYTAPPPDWARDIRVSCSS